MSFKRIQFTPDLLPGDITGGYVFNSAREPVRPAQGPDLCQILLADEINRASPKTQSALLEAMQEYQVTLEGETEGLPLPFIVIATQNPIEHEGTFPLPEAQLDRFIVQAVRRATPRRRRKTEILRQRSERRQGRSGPARRDQPETFLAMRETAEDVYVDPDVRRYIVDLVGKTRQHRQVVVGASPRASIALLKLARRGPPCRAGLCHAGRRQAVRPARPGSPRRPGSHPLGREDVGPKRGGRGGALGPRARDSRAVPRRRPPPRRLQMTRRAVALSTLALALLLGGLATRNGTVALLSLPVLAYLGVGLLEAPAWSPAQPGLRAERTLDFTRTPASTAVHVRVTLLNEGAPIPFLRLSDPLQGEAALADGSSERCDSLRQGDAAELSYTFHATRGVFQWKSVHASASDQFRLFVRGLEVPAAGEIVVRPRVRRFRPFSLNPDRTLRTPGSILGGRPAAAPISGACASTSRETRCAGWTGGAPPGTPGSTSRGSTSRRRSPTSGWSWTRGCRPTSGRGPSARRARVFPTGSWTPALHSAEMFLRGGNRVGLVLLENQMNVVYPGYGKAQLYRVLRALADVRRDAETSHVSMDHVPLRLFSTRAMLVIISPLSVGEWQLFPRLRARGNEGLLISPDPVDFMKHLARDDGSRLAARVARVERRLDLRRVSQLGIRVIDWRVGTPLAPLVRRAMQPVRGRG